ncbi:MAG: energy transducer TonB [Gammaproteobacteria bacterium]|nr:energy transducer TonB [Gammaproteobacteria bacterium]
MTSTILNSATNSEPVITSTDRMSFSLFIATAFHALILLGISFALPDKSIQHFQRTLDVVLATEFSEERPEEADFIGQIDQIGGGESDDAERLSTTELSPFPDEQMNDITQPEHAQLSIPQVEENQVLTSEIAMLKQNQPDTQPIEETEQVESLTSEDIYSLSLEIASFTAQLEAEKNYSAKRPRKRRISAAIHRSSDALYLDSWRRKIERIGNLNYPEKAKRENIFGSLSLNVSIKSDGTVNNISIIRSSGHKVLDDSAIRIVRLAAPFAPLTKEMMIDTDILEIVRVWQFQPDNKINTQ